VSNVRTAQRGLTAAPRFMQQRLASTVAGASPKRGKWQTFKSVAKYGTVGAVGYGLYSKLLLAR